MDKKIRRLLPTNFLVGVTGFEPAASWSRTKRSTKLSHTPFLCRPIIIPPPPRVVKHKIHIFQKDFQSVIIDGQSGI